MFKKYLLILIIPFFIFCSIPIVEANEPSPFNSYYYIKKLNNIQYGEIYAYAGSEICGVAHVMISISNCYRLEIYPFYDINDITEFKYEYKDAIVDMTIIKWPDLDKTPSFENYIELDLDNLEPFPIDLNFYVDNNLITNYSLVINIGDTFKINKIEGVYSDDSVRDISDSCFLHEQTTNDNVVLLERINTNEFKAIRSGEIRIFTSYNTYRTINGCIIINIIDTPPSLLTSSITDNAINVSPDSIYTFQFDRPIQQGNDFSSVAILNSQGIPLGISKNISGDTLIIKPLINLNQGANYMFYIPVNSIKSLGDSFNTTDLIYHFTTLIEESNQLVESIQVDGTEIQNFNPNKKVYNIELPAGTTITPTITVTTKDKQADINIPPITAIPGSVEVTIRSADGTINQSYILNFTISDSDQCFIATAAYGSLLEPHVQILRQFRDNVLMQFSGGRWFVKEYYHHSPPIAKMIVNNEGLKFIIRIILTPIIFSIEYWKGILIAFIGILLFLNWRRKFIIN